MTEPVHETAGQVEVRLLRAGIRAMSFIHQHLDLLLPKNRDGWGCETCLDAALDALRPGPKRTVEDVQNTVCPDMRRAYADLAAAQILVTVMDDLHEQGTVG